MELQSQLTASEKRYQETQAMLSKLNHELNHLREHQKLELTQMRKRENEDRENDLGIGNH